ncbi:MAG: MarR family transcriptional regulator [Nocardia sp.]|nr:MarR family transcriptional regulator [Nocardia sp.]
MALYIVAAVDDSIGPAALVGLARSLRQVSQELDRTLAGCVGESSVARCHVLAALADGSGRSMSQLAEASLLTGASLTRLVDGMINDNLVLRKVDDHDRRRVLVMATRRGMLTHEVMTRAVEDSGLAIAAAEHDRLVAALAAVLDRIRLADTAPLPGPR